MSVRREAANHVPICCWYQSRCGAVGVHLGGVVRGWGGAGEHLRQRARVAAQPSHVRVLAHHVQPEQPCEAMRQAVSGNEQSSPGEALRQAVSGNEQSSLGEACDKLLVAMSRAA
jgi:hypothetical protein